MFRAVFRKRETSSSPSFFSPTVVPMSLYIYYTTTYNSQNHIVQDSHTLQKVENERERDSEIYKYYPMQIQAIRFSGDSGPPSKYI